MEGDLLPDLEGVVEGQFSLVAAGVAFYGILALVPLLGTNGAANMAGLRRVRVASAALSTSGLSMLRKRGRAAAGAALVAAAVGLSLLKRQD